MRSILVGFGVDQTGDAVVQLCLQTGSAPGLGFSSLPLLSRQSLTCWADPGEAAKSANLLMVFVLNFTRPSPICRIAKFHGFTGSLAVFSGRSFDLHFGSPCRVQVPRSTGGIMVRQDERVKVWVRLIGVLDDADQLVAVDVDKPVDSASNPVVVGSFRILIPSNLFGQKGVGCDTSH